MNVHMNIQTNKNSPVGDSKAIITNQSGIHEKLDAVVQRHLTHPFQKPYQVHTQKATSEIVDGEECVHRMNFADGTHLETDVILFSAGIRPYDNLAREFDLSVGERGGIVVDNNCLTSDENIYAIGECALWNNFIFGLVAPGYTMAKVVADNILGGQQQFTGADMSTKLKLLGCDVGSIGVSARISVSARRNRVWHNTRCSKRRFNCVGVPRQIKRHIAKIGELNYRYFSRGGIVG